MSSRLLDPSREHGDGRRDGSSLRRSSWVTDFLKVSVFNSLKTHVRQSQALMMWTDGGGPSGTCQQQVRSFSLQNSKSLTVSFGNSVSDFMLSGSLSF